MLLKNLKIYAKIKCKISIATITRKVFTMLKKIINLGAVYYTAISAVFLIFGLMFGDAGAVLLTPFRFIMILLFSFVMSVGSYFKYGDVVSKTAGGILHVICYIGGFFFCILLPSGNKFSFTVIALVIFSIGYIAVCLIRSHLEKKKGSSARKTRKVKAEKPQKEKKAPEEEYKSLFSEGDGK